MHVIIWQFEIKHDKRKEFESGYSANGTWSDFFRRSPGYLGTRLFQDTSSDDCYCTLDYWTSQTAYDEFRLQHIEEYRRLDKLFEKFTLHEIIIGTLEQAGTALPPGKLPGNVIEEK